MSALLETLPEEIWPGHGTACLINGYATDKGLVQEISIRAEVMNSTGVPATSPGCGIDLTTVATVFTLTFVAGLT